METTVFRVGGMTCGGCVNSVRKVLAATNGVGHIDVSLEKAQATVEYDAAKTNAAALRSAVAGAGFETD
jgi:copper chaperone